MGCPLAATLFTLALAAPLQDIQNALATEGIQATILAYMDDITILLPHAHLKRALEISIIAMRTANLTLNSDKTAGLTPGQNHSPHASKT